MTLYALSIESMIRGYHKYKLIRNNPFVGEDLLCECEVGNPHDTHAVAVKKAGKKVIDGNLTIVWHTDSAKNIFNLLHVFETWW